MKEARNGKTGLAPIEREKKIQKKIRKALSLSPSKKVNSKN